MYKNYNKRLLDILLSLIAICFCLPIFIITSICIRIHLGSPILFKQKRVGLKEQIFTIYKFRTMSEQKDSQGNLLSDEERMTRLGKFLRVTSIDELPELWNILKGDMSIVGPRPLLVRYLPRYTLEQRMRHHVKPGITGCAQVEGRNALSWIEKFKYDIYYVQHISFLLDIKIICKTVKIVLLRKGISSKTSVTMEEFYGNERQEKQYAE